MGGYGSGRWGTGKADAKGLVESCRELDINRLVREGLVRPEARRRGSWEWLDEGGAVLASIGLAARTGEESGTIRLSYAVTRPGRGREVQDYPIPLVTTSLPSGGRRWWFRCAASRGGGPPCGRRVGKLYLPRGGTVFACRCCHDLTYESCRESSRGSGLWASLGASVGLDGRRARRWRAARRQRGRIEGDGA
jgi:hypothetical protein